MFSSTTPDSSTGWAEKTFKTFRGASLSHCMQHVSTVSTYPGSCKTCFSHIPVFGRKVFLIFPIIYLTVDLKLICIIGQSDLINSLIFANIYPGQHNYFGGFFSIFTGQLALKFLETRHVSFWLISTVSTYKFH